jgi:hypothetical protein
MYKLFVMEFHDLECASTNESGCQHLVVRQICEVGISVLIRHKGSWFSERSKGYRYAACTVCVCVCARARARAPPPPQHTYEGYCLLFLCYVLRLDSVFKFN